MEGYVPTHEEFTIVARVANIVSSVRGVNPDYTRLAVELEPAVPFDVLGVVLLRHDGQAVRVTVCQREYGSWKASYHQHPLSDSRFEQLLYAPRILAENNSVGFDGPPSRTGDALSGFPYLHAMLIVPLVVGERVLGTLELGSARFNAYTDITLQRLIQAVADVLATAIESAQMGGSAAIQDRQRQALKDVSSALTAEMDLSIVLNHIVVGISHALNVSSAIITLEQQRTLRLQAYSDLDPVLIEHMLKQANAMLSDQSVIGYSLRHRQPLVLLDISTDERFPECQSLANEWGVQTVYCYPLLTDMAIYGVLVLCSPDPGGLTPLKEDIVTLFASQSTVAIHNSRLLEAARQRRRFQEAIEQLEQAHTDVGGLEEDYALLRRVREASLQTFGVSFTNLLRFMSNHLLTQGERDWQNLFQEDTQQTAETFSDDDVQQEEHLAFLTHTAEATLNRISMMSDVGAALAGAQDPARPGSPFAQLSHYGSGDANDAWFVIDLDGDCVYMNHPAELFCGRRKEHLGAPFIVSNDVNPSSTLDQLFISLFPRMRNRDEVCTYLDEFTHDMPAALTCRCVMALDTLHARSVADSPSSHHQQLLDSAPTDRHYQFSRFLLNDQQGQLIAYGLQVHDITEHVRDEKNRSALLSSVSHDLRTPLATIKAAVSGLLQPEIAWDDETRRKILAEVEAETDHLTVLVTALVDMSRIEMGALVLDKEWCDVIEIVYSNLVRLERILAQRPVRTVFQPGLPLVFVDHVQLGRVFYNLIENAARNSPEGSEIIITLDVVSTENQTQMLRVQVVDHGYGIPEGERERIFRSFYGFSARGNGLGLAICKGIIEAHQGHIWVEPALGSGSCFICTLPLHDASTGSIQYSQEKATVTASFFSSLTGPVQVKSEEQR